MYRTPFINLEFWYNKIYLFLTDDHSWFWLLLKKVGLTLFIVLAISIPFIIFGIIRLSRAINSLSARDEEDKAPDVPEEEVKNERWEKVLARLSTDSESEWKLAVIEADAMLDELVRSAFPHAGDNLGDRLKNIEPSDFITLQDAWDAHKTRNNLAHNSEARLSEREARIAIEGYRKVFEEFHFI